MGLEWNVEESAPTDGFHRAFTSSNGALGISCSVQLCYVSFFAGIGEGGSRRQLVVPVNLKDAAPVLSGQAFEEDILFEEGSIDAVYQAKARVLSSAIREIGMGRYQWYLFIVAGFGWFSDSVWQLVASLILNPVVSEFDVESSWLSLALNIGFFVGAVFWALGCDTWGRRWPFNFTLLISPAYSVWLREGRTIS